MKALLKKEMAEQSAMLVTATVIALAVWFERLFGGPPKRWLLLDGEHLKIAVLSAAVVGLIWGYLQFATEQWRGTSGYLRHRGAGDRGAFLAKALVGVLATLWISIGTGISAAVWHRYASHLGPAIDLRAWLDLLWIAPVAPVAFACGALGALLKRHALLDLSWALLAAAGVAGITLQALPVESIGGLVLLVALPIGVASWMLRTAYGLFSRPDDPDRALPARRELAVVAVSALIVMPLAAWALTVTTFQLQWGMRMAGVTVVREIASDRILAAMQSGREWFLADERATDGSRISIEGNFTALTRFYGREKRHELVYAPIHADSRDFPARPEVGTPKLPRRRLLVSGLVGLQGRPLSHTANQAAFAALTWFDASHASIDIVWTNASVVEPTVFDEVRPDFAESLPLRRSFPWSAGEPFPILANDRGLPYPLLLLGSDQSLWKFDPRERDHALVPWSLPEEDRLLGLVNLVEEEPARAGRLTTAFEGMRAFRGERATWLWQSAGWRRLDESVVGAITEGQALEIAELRTELDANDVLAPVVTVEDARTGEVVFHRSLWREGSCPPRAAVTLHLLQLLRSPVATLHEFTSDDPQASLSRIDWRSVVSLVQNGRRAWLVVAQLMVVGVLSWSAWRRLDRRSAPVWLRAAWVAVLLWSGPLAWLLLRWLEPRKAQRRAAAAEGIARDGRLIAGLETVAS